MKNIKISILDYGRGNVQSIRNALASFGVSALLVNTAKEIHSSDGVILPGVGAFAAAMADLKERDLIEPLQSYAKLGKPLMGICLGMQLLFDKSEEFGENIGLGIIPGDVRKLIPRNSEKLPHVKWTGLTKGNQAWKNTILKDIKEENRFYFVHSFECIPKDSNVVLSFSSFGSENFCSSVKLGNTYGCQFHPEKSCKEGINILKNFVDVVMENYS